MKNRLIAMLLAIVLCSLIPFGEAAAEEILPPGESRFMFPSSLVEIEEEAFADTAVKTAYFRKGLRSIGDKAFSGAALLTDVYIPTSTEHIGAQAIPQNMRLRVHGERHSYASKWAQSHHVSFAPRNIWGTARTDTRIIKVEKVRIAPVRPNRAEKENRLHARRADEGRTMRPQERPELNPIDYRFP